MSVHNSLQLVNHSHNFNKLIKSIRSEYNNILLESY